MNGLEFCVPNSRGWSWWRLVIVANLARRCGWSSSSLVIVVVVVVATTLVDGIMVVGGHGRDNRGGGWSWS